LAGKRRLKLREEALALQKTKFGPENPPHFRMRGVAISYEAPDWHAEAMKLRRAAGASESRSA
jgi:hypothetical protein